jgi:hypothetical protein
MGSADSKLNALNTPMQPLQQDQVGRIGVVACFHLPAPCSSLCGRLSDELRVESKVFVENCRTAVARKILKRQPKDRQLQSWPSENSWRRHSCR